MKTLEIYVQNKTDPIYVGMDNNGNLLYKPNADLEWDTIPGYEEIRIEKKYRGKIWGNLKKRLSESEKVKKVREIRG